MDEFELKYEISKWVDAHEDELLSDVAKLVAIKSVKSEAKEGMPFGEGSAEAMNEAVKLFSKYGFACENMQNYAAYADLNASKETAVDILGHLDIVGEGDGWDTDPYVMVKKDDGCIYGRGTDDDKGPVVASLYAMRCVKELGVKLSKNARLIVGGDEESGSELDLEHYYKRFSPAKATFSPDASFPIFNTEKGNYKPEFKKSFAKSDALPRVTKFSGGYRINVLPANAEAVIAGMDISELEKTAAEKVAELGVTYKAEKAEGGIKLSVTGKAAHASTPEEGVNGLTALISILCALPLADCASTRALSELNTLLPFGDNYGKALGIAQEDEISGKLTVAFSLLEMTEDSVCGRFDSRTSICADDENCRIICEKAFEKYGYEISGQMSAPHHTPADGEFVKVLSSVYEECTGEKCECLSMGGGTYVHNIEGGVAFGASRPDFQSNLHSANERANIKDLLSATKIFANVIARLCK